MRNIDHIGIAVVDLEKSVELFASILNSACYKTETVESEKVTTAFFKTGETKLELVASEEADSPISKFIGKKGEGLHHIAFAVADIEHEMQRLQGLGYRLVQEKPIPGADNKLVCFIHPKETNGVLIELCQEMK